MKYNETIQSLLNSNILCMQVRSPCKWFCYPQGSLLLFWRYYISRSWELTASQKQQLVFFILSWLLAFLQVVLQVCVLLIAFPFVVV